MRNMRWLTSFIFFVVALVLLSACGTSLEKPTGLEEIDTGQTEVEETQSSEPLASNLGIATNIHFSADQLTNGKITSHEQSADQEEKKDDKQVQEETNSQTTEKESSSSAHQSVAASQQKTGSQEQVNRSTEEKNSPSTPTSSTQKKKERSKDSSKDSSKEKEEKKEAPAPEAPEAEEPKNTIVISVVISDNEVPLPPTELEIEDGDSVLDALIAITMEQGIQMDYRGGQGASAYVEGIGNVYEFDRGPGSGWMYRVNGIFPNKGAGVIPLYGADRVEWLYTENLGEDLGADLQPFR